MVRLHVGNACDHFLVACQTSAVELKEAAAKLIVANIQEVRDTAGMTRLRDDPAALFELIKLTNRNDIL